MIEFKDVPVGDIFVDLAEYFRKISDHEAVELADGSIRDCNAFTCGDPGDVQEFLEDDEVDTVDDAKKQALLNAHKAFLLDLANLFGVIL